MGVTLKPLTLLLIVALAFSSLVMVEFASAEPIPKPSVPEFTVQFENNSIIVKIQNQQFDGSGLSLKHTVRLKINSGHDWKIIERPVIRSPSSTYVSDSSLKSIYRYHIEGYTVLSYDWNGTNIKTMAGDLYLKSDDQVSFQVQASIGRVAELPMPLGGTQYFNETSEWSNIQTITMPEFVATPAPTSTHIFAAPIDFQPFIVPVVFVAVVTVLGVCVFVYDFKKQKSV